MNTPLVLTGPTGLTATLFLGDCLAVLPTLAAESVHCVVTSPPYWGLRDYGVAGQLGLEPTPEEYVAHLVAVFQEVRRVLRDDGTVWLNLGDSYASDTKGSGGNPENGRQGGGCLTMQHFKPRHVQHGLKPKDLVGIPWRVAFALQAAGWWLRQDIIWHKPNPMPESVTDRCTKAHEYIFLLTKSARYYYDAEAVKEKSSGPGRIPGGNHKVDAARNDADRDMTIPVSPTRNRRSVWTIATTPYAGAHFATFPPKLVEPCILAGTSERGCCPVCGKPWERVVARQAVPRLKGKSSAVPGDPRELKGSLPRNLRTDASKSGFGTPTSVTTGFRPACTCPEQPPVPCTVLDPFAGSGTALMVAVAHGRNASGCELNPEYIALAQERIGDALKRPRLL